MTAPLLHLVRPFQLSSYHLYRYKQIDFSHLILPAPIR
jgi:hypothetical protein